MYFIIFKYNHLQSLFANYRENIRELHNTCIMQRFGKRWQSLTRCRNDRYQSSPEDLGSVSSYSEVLGVQ